MQMVFKVEVQYYAEAEFQIIHKNVYRFGSSLRGISWRRQRPDAIALNREDLMILLDGLTKAEGVEKFRSYIHSMLCTLR